MNTNLKLLYKKEEAPTSWGLVNVPQIESFSSGSIGERNYNYNKALELALNKWIPIRVEDQEEVTDHVAAIVSLNKHCSYEEFVSWTPTESKLYDIPEGMEFEISHKCSSRGFESCEKCGSGECTDMKQFYALKSKT